MSLRTERKRKEKKPQKTKQKTTKKKPNKKQKNNRDAPKVKASICFYKKKKTKTKTKNTIPDTENIITLLNRARVVL